VDAEQVSLYEKNISIILILLFAPTHHGSRRRLKLEALFLGHAYIDLTMQTDCMPTGDEKAVAKDYAVSFGGNAVTAGFACAKLGRDVHLLTSVAQDWLGHMFLDMAQNYGIKVHPRSVKRSSLSFILPNNGQRAILRARDDEYLENFPILNLSPLKLLHLDGHMPDAAIFYAKKSYEQNTLVSLDGGALRPGLIELLSYVHVAIVSERLCQQMSLSPDQMLFFLKGKGVKIGGVTIGSKGMLWYDETGVVQHLPSLRVPKEKIIDTSGAGDVFHGAYCASYLERPNDPWRNHFIIARAGAAHKIQRLGNEAGLPSQKDILYACSAYLEGE